MTVPPTVPPPAPPPGPPPGADPTPIGEAGVDDERQEDLGLRDLTNRLALRTWVIIAVVLWLAAVATLVVVLGLWQTPPLRPVPLR